MELERRYGQNTDFTYESELMKVTNIKSSDFANLNAYLSHFRAHIENLQEMGEQISGRMQSTFFKTGLPEDLKPYTFTIYEDFKKGKQEVDLGYVVDRLNGMHLPHDTSAKALKGSNKKGGKDSKRTKCTRCNGAHDLKNCWHEHPDQAPSTWKPTSKNDKKEKKEKEKKDDFTKGAKDTQSQSKAFFNTSKSDQDKSLDIIIDSGDQEHLMWDRSKFLTYQKVEGEHIAAYGPNPQLFKVHGKGTVRIPAIIEGKIRSFDVENVRHVPEGEDNLLSTTQLDLAGYHHIGGSGRKTFYDDDNQVVLQGYLHDRHYLLDTAWKRPIQAMRVKSSELSPNHASWTQWHKRLGHISMEATKAVAKATYGINVAVADRLQKSEPHELCDSCMSGKMTKSPSRVPRTRSDKKGEAWHMDTSMASHTTTIGGHTYILTATDEATSMCYLYHMERKSQLPQMIKQHLNFCRSRGIQVAYINGDNELTQSAELRAMYVEWGIQVRPTAPYNPHQDGIAERRFRTLWQQVRSVLIDAGLPQKFWGEAIYYVNYIRNLVPTKGGKTPFEQWYNQVPEASYLKPFGIWCWSYDMNPHLKKLDARGIRCRFLGHEGKSIYRVWDIQNEKVIRSANVTFDEQKHTDLTMSEGMELDSEPDPDDIINPDDYLDDLDNLGQRSNIGSNQPRLQAAEIPHLNQVEEVHNHQIIEVTEEEASQADNLSDNDQQITEENADPIQSPLTSLQASPSPLTSPQASHSPPPAPRRSTRQVERQDYRAIAQGKGFMAKALKLQVHNRNIPVPKDAFEALHGPDQALWKEAMEREMDNHRHQRSWDHPSKPPAGTRVLGGRWVFAYKLHPIFGEIIKRKARWVAKGYEQEDGDYYSPTIKDSSWRILMALAAKHNLVLELSDVVSAYLESLISEDVWVEQPHGYTDGQKGHACHLRKALYGLKGSASDWYDTLSQEVQQHGFEVIPNDRAMFINRETHVIIACYVDDILIASPIRKEITQIKSKLDLRFRFKHMGDVKDYLGMQITRDITQRTLHINQKAYIKLLLDRMGMADCHPTKTPTERGTYLGPPDPEYTSPSDLKEAYQALIGLLNWISQKTRPDITYACSQLSRYLNNPSPDHMAAAKHLLRYLSGTSSYGVLYTPDADDQLVGYTDASYADDKATSKSTGAYAYRLHGSLISWSSKLQPIVTTSSCESEYVAAAEAAKEAIYLSNLIAQMGFTEATHPIIIRADNQASIKLANNPTNHNATKHIRVRFHFIRDLISSREISLQWVDTKAQVADPLTKPLPYGVFPGARGMLGLAPSEVYDQV